MSDTMVKVDIEKLVPVFLLKIATVTATDSSGAVLTFEEGQDISDPVTVDAAYVTKYSPQAGGYYVMCSNGVGMYSAA